MATDTGEIDPIRGYLDAVQAYEQERTKAKTLIDRISTVANAMQKPSIRFLGTELQSCRFNDCRG
jgi:hypothetical protein